MIISRYILKEHIQPFFMSISFLTFVFLIDQIMRLLDLVIGKGISPFIVIKLFLLTLPFIVSLTIPMSVLVAVLLAFGRLSYDGEIIAMRSCGIGVWKLIRPLIIAAVIIFLLMTYFNSFILPITNHEIIKLFVSINKIKPTAILEEGMLNNITDKYSIYIGKIDNKTFLLKDIIILDKSYISPTFISANEGSLFYNIDKDLLIFELNNGSIQKTNYGAQEDEFYLIKFAKYNFSFPLNTKKLEESERKKGERELSFFELREIINELKKERKNILENYNFLYKKIKDKPINEISENEKMMLEEKEVQLKYNKIKLYQNMAELQKKISLPFACIIFVLLGSSLGMVTKRGGKIGLSLSVFFFMFYYITLIGGQTLSDKGLINPIITMWFPNVIMGILSLILLWYNKNEGNIVFLPKLLNLFKFKVRK